MQPGHLARIQQTLVNTHLVVTSRQVCVCVNPHITTTELQEGTLFCSLMFWNTSKLLRMSKFCHTTIKVAVDIGEHPVLLVYRGSHMLNYLHSYYEKTFANKICCALFSTVLHILVDAVKNRKQYVMLVTLWKNSKSFTLSKNSIHVWELRSSGILCSK